MDPRSVPAMYLAPGSAASSTPAHAPGRHTRLPAVNERLVAPEAHAQILDGRVYRTLGSGQPHGTRHFEAAHVFAGALAEGYLGAVNMLTRADEDSDAAPDISVFPAAPDPTTGGRQLEAIAVEVLDTERMGHATDKVEKLAARGVRRLFAIRVANRRVYEWDHSHHDWTELAPDAVLTDPCFRVPIPAGALVDRVLADDTIARALLARGNPVLAAALDTQRDAGREMGLRDGREAGLRDGREAGLRDGREAGLRDGREAGLRDALRTLARAAGIPLAATDDARIEACGDVATLDRWIANGRTAMTAAELLR